MVILNLDLSIEDRVECKKLLDDKKKRLVSKMIPINGYSELKGNLEVFTF